jgi:hypothetical protein
MLISPIQMAQMQFLLSQLQMVRFFSFLAPQRLQVAKARNQQIITGNLAAVTTGAQNANPINVA